MSKHLVPLLCAAAAMATVAAPAFAAKRPAAHVRVALVAERTALVPGQRNWVGLRLTHDPHWHTYWVNPGDSGLPTRLKWKVPEGFSAGEIAWPVPERFDAGGLHDFGYDGDVVLPVPLEVDRSVRKGRRAHLSAEVHWLACREECIPGKASLKLSVPVAAHARTNTRLRKLFAAAHAAQPRADTWRGHARLVGNRVEVTLAGSDLPPAADLDALVVQNQVVGYDPPRATADGDGLRLSFDKSKYLTTPPVALDLVLVEQRQPNVHAHSVSVPFTAPAHPADPAAKEQSP